jgi:hypothetical protein
MNAMFDIAIIGSGPGGGIAKLTSDGRFSGNGGS